MSDVLKKLLSNSLEKHFKPIKSLDLSEWSEEHVYLPSGTSAIAGQWRTIAYQEEIFKTIEDPKVNKITLMFGAQLGKCLALDTPIATSNGFKPLADIKVGDLVFDENGQSCNVVFVTNPMYNKPCYKIRFSDGAEVITDDSHLWQMHYSNSGATNGSKHQVVIKSTKEMVDEGYKHIRIDKHGKSKVRNYYSVDVTKPVQYEKKELAICPYILGLWLGDGVSKSNAFTFCGDDYIEFTTHIIDEGHNVSVSKSKRIGNSADVRIDNKMRRDPNTFGKIMRNEFGLMKKGKFIPEVYLRASYDDRLSLLQGLMDTDGTVSKKGRCQFTTVFKALSDGFGDLLGGLGIKYTVKTYYPTFTYKGEKRTGQLVYDFGFTVYDDMPIFRLERKLKRLKSKLAENTRVTEATRRKIISIESCQSVPVKCIQVDSPSHLYLCTKWYIPTHNTSIVNNTIGYY